MARKNNKVFLLNFALFLVTVERGLEHYGRIQMYDVNNTEHGQSSPSEKVRQAACPTMHVPE